ncbi:MAG: MBL fold metallo-hydrolase [Frankiaceae bacterium]|nr:MBL fold metallo-hydrolase [Frankiaceae bacterium]
MEVCFLGTGTPSPDPLRCGSGVAVISRDASWVLVDCGRGVTHRALEAGLDLGSLIAVLLTHHHSDHVSDLATLAITRFVAGAPSALRVVAPAGPCRRFAETCLDGFEDQAFYSQRTAGVSERPAVGAQGFVPSIAPARVLGEGGWVVLSAQVDHGPIESATGYRIELDGLAVAVSGDTVVCDGIRNLASGVDLLVHEALLSERSSAEALAWNASACSVGSLANDAQVGQLALTHLLPTPRGEGEERLFVEEARSGGFTGRIDAVSDLDRMSVGVRGNHNLRRR